MNEQVRQLFCDFHNQWSSWDTEKYHIKIVNKLAQKWLINEGVILNV